MTRIRTMNKRAKRRVRPKAAPGTYRFEQRLYFARRPDGLYGTSFVEMLREQQSHERVTRTSSAQREKVAAKCRPFDPSLSVLKSCPRSPPS